jgi:hypothetical protein
MNERRNPMQRLPHRTAPLTKRQQLAFLQKHVPGRIESIQSALSGEPSYRDLAVAAIFSRSIAGFLGVGVRSGRLCADRDYFPHLSGQSWEVKISDVGGEFIDLDTLSGADKSALEEGLNETNRAFAHLTFWPDSSSQDESGLATDAYVESQSQRVRAFADTVIRLFHERASATKPA